MTPEERAELIRLYKKTGGGHIWLSDTDFAAYAALRKKEYQDRKAEFILAHPTATMKAKKDDTGDIVGSTDDLIRYPV